MNKSEDISKLAAALVAVQQEIGPAKMDRVNPFFKSKYADLSSVWDAVRAPLQGNSLAISQFPDQTATGEPALTTILMHGSGQWIAATYPLSVSGKDATPQGYGSAMTYAKRYGLSAVLGVIADEDDDGNAASQKPAKPSPVAQGIERQVPDLKAEGSNPSGTTMTPEQWAQKAVTIILGANAEKLHEFTEKHHAKIAQYRVGLPKLHAEIIKAIQHRNAELGA